jgi:ATP-binding cassette subfamily B protein
LTLLSLVLVPAFLLPSRIVGGKLAAITRESYQLDAQMSTTMTERFGVAGALLVKLFGRPSAEAERFAGRASRVRDIGVQQAMYGTTFFVALMLVASLAQALTYGVGGWLAVNGTIDAGTVVSLALLLTGLYGPITGLSNARVNVMSALVSFERVFEVLDLPPAIAEKPDAIDLPAGASRVEFRESPSATVGGGGLARLARGRGGARPHDHRAGPQGCVAGRRARSDGGLGGAVGRREVDHGDAGASGLRRHRRRRACRRR